MDRLTIAIKPEGDRPSQRKGRAFSALTLAHVVCDALWEGGSAETDDVRPVWLMLAGLPTELRPFLANLRMGRRAELSPLTAERSSYSRAKPTRVALLKSAGYAYATQRMADGSEVVTAYLPELLNLDPGMIDPDDCRFLCLTPRWWADAQLPLLDLPAVVRAGRRVALPAEVVDGVLAELAPVAVRVAAYLEARTRRPIPSDPAFSLYLLLSGLTAGIFSLSQTDASADAHRFDDPYRRARNLADDPWFWARQKWAVGFWERGTGAAGLLPGVACLAPHARLDPFLAAAIRGFQE